MKDYKEIAEIVKVQRSLKGWSQKELAKKSHVSPATINFVENQIKEVRLGTLIKIAKALEIDYRLFLEDKE